MTQDELRCTACSSTGINAAGTLGGFSAEGTVLHNDGAQKKGSHIVEAVREGDGRCGKLPQLKHPKVVLLSALLRKIMERGKVVAVLRLAV